MSAASGQTMDKIIVADGYTSCDWNEAMIFAGRHPRGMLTDAFKQYKLSPRFEEQKRLEYSLGLSNLMVFLNQYMVVLLNK